MNRVKFLFSPGNQAWSRKKEEKEKEGRDGGGGEGRRFRSRLFQVEGKNQKADESLTNWTEMATGRVNSDPSTFFFFASEAACHLFD